MRMSRCIRPALALVLAIGLGEGSAAAKPPTSVQDAMVPVSYLNSSATPQAATKGPKGRAGTHLNLSANRGVPGIESLTNFTDQFTEPGFDSDGNPQSVWPYAMVGRAPQQGGPTFISAPIIPVVLDLLGPDGKVATTPSGHPFTFDPRGHIQPMLRSPMFQFSSYSSGFTQFNDAHMRNQFWDRIHRRGDDDNGYHVFLIPSVKTVRHMQIPFGSWRAAIDADGVPVFALVEGGVFTSLLFPATVPVDNTTPIGAAELAGEMTTRDMTSLTFDNVYLYNGDPSNCCVLGFHSADFEPGDAHNGNKDRLFVMNYSSWISPGLFSLGFGDITAWSHELNETFNNPLGINATPWWLNTDAFLGSSICQNNLETGDVIEIMSTPTFPIFMNGMTYHPQNESNFSWFAFVSPSAAKNGSYSFPDETVLTTLSPSNLMPGCVPGP